MVGSKKKNIIVLSVLLLEAICVILFLPKLLASTASNDTNCDIDPESCVQILDREVGDVVESEKWMVALTNMQVSQSGQQNVVAVSLLIQNTSNHPLVFETNSEMHISDANGNTFYTDTELSVRKGGYVSQMIYEPGQMTETTVYFRLPLVVEDSSLIIHIYDFGKIVIPVLNQTIG